MLTRNPRQQNKPTERATKTRSCSSVFRVKEFWWILVSVRIFFLFWTQTSSQLILKFVPQTHLKPAASLCHFSSKKSGGTGLCPRSGTNTEPVCLMNCLNVEPRMKRTRVFLLTAVWPRNKPETSVTSGESGYANSELSESCRGPRLVPETDQDLVWSEGFWSLQALGRLSSPVKLHSGSWCDGGLTAWRQADGGLTALLRYGVLGEEPRQIKVWWKIKWTVWFDVRIKWFVNKNFRCFVSSAGGASNQQPDVIDQLMIWQEVRSCFQSETAELVDSNQNYFITNM